MPEEVREGSNGSIVGRNAKEGGCRYEGLPALI